MTDKHIEELIPTDWRFNSADFSIPDQPGSVLLTRTPEQTTIWHKLLNESGLPVDEFDIPLYISGQGETLDDAIRDAVVRCPPGKLTYNPEQSWEKIESAAKLVEQWSVTQPKEVRHAVLRIISVAFGEQAVKEIEEILNG
jgi:hypothetical protein